MTEKVVAILPSSTDVEFAEPEMFREISAFELKAEGFIVENENDYIMAAEYARALKRMESKVKDFWKPQKEAAHKTHRLICEKENLMLTSVKRAIAIMKEAMASYTQAQARQQKAIEAEARRLAGAETDRLLEKAVAAAESGDTQEATNILIDAQIVDSISRIFAIAGISPKAEGVSHRKSWEITAVDPNLVPININGVEIRPVNEAAVMRLIKGSKGTIQIPGIEYRETINTIIRK